MPGQAIAILFEIFGHPTDRRITGQAAQHMAWQWTEWTECNRIIFPSPRQVDHYALRDQRHRDDCEQNRIDDCDDQQQNAQPVFHQVFRRLPLEIADEQDVEKKEATHKADEHVGGHHRIGGHPVEEPLMSLDQIQTGVLVVAYVALVGSAYPDPLVQAFLVYEGLRAGTGTRLYRVQVVLDQLQADAAVSAGSRLLCAQTQRLSGGAFGGLAEFASDSFDEIGLQLTFVQQTLIQRVERNNRKRIRARLLSQILPRQDAFLSARRRFRTLSLQPGKA